MLERNHTSPSSYGWVVLSTGITLRYVIELSTKDTEVKTRLTCRRNMAVIEVPKLREQERHDSFGGMQIGSALLGNV